MRRRFVSRCGLSFAAFLAACSVPSKGVRVPDKTVERIPKKVISVKRPTQPTVNRIAANILEIDTHGHDLDFHKYLRPNRRTIVQFGAYWCTPCTILKSVIRKRGSKENLDFLSIDLTHPDGKDGNDDIHSPLYELLKKQGATGLPFFLVYDGTTLRGAIHFDPNDRRAPFDRIVQDAKALH